MSEQNSQIKKKLKSLLYHDLKTPLLWKKDRPSLSAKIMERAERCPGKECTPNVKLYCHPTWVTTLKIQSRKRHSYLSSLSLHKTVSRVRSTFWWNYKWQLKLLCFFYREGLWSVLRLGVVLGTDWQSKSVNRRQKKKILLWNYRENLGSSCIFSDL